MTKTYPRRPWQLVACPSWSRDAQAVGLAALAWAVLVPGGSSWMAVLATSLIGSAATALLGRSQGGPALARVDACEEAAPALVRACGGCTSGAELRV